MHITSITVALLLTPLLERIRVLRLDSAVHHMMVQYSTALRRTVHTYKRVCNQELSAMQSFSAIRRALNAPQSNVRIGQLVLHVVTASDIC
jgi:hypothetical protein